MTNDTPPVEKHSPSREDIDAWLKDNCGVGIPFKDATDSASMLHGLAYILRQIESTNKYMVYIGQTGPATSALLMALDRFAVEALHVEFDQIRALPASQKTEELGK